MPTCINVNNFCENFSPTQDDKTELRWEDVVKVY
jgi:methionine aminopeptidase